MPVDPHNRLNPHNTQQAARLSQNCRVLLGLIKTVDAQLARVTISLVRRQASPPASMEEAMQKLMQVCHGRRMGDAQASGGGSGGPPWCFLVFSVCPRLAWGGRAPAACAGAVARLPVSSMCIWSVGVHKNVQVWVPINCAFSCVLLFTNANAPVLNAGCRGWRK